MERGARAGATAAVADFARGHGCRWGHGLLRLRLLLRLLLGRSVRHASKVEALVG